MLNAVDFIKPFSNALLDMYKDKLDFTDDVDAVNKIILNMVNNWNSYQWTLDFVRNYPEFDEWIWTNNVREFIIFLIYYFEKLGYVVNIENLSLKFPDEIKTKIRNASENDPVSLRFDHIKLPEYSATADHLICGLDIRYVTTY